MKLKGILPERYLPALQSIIFQVYLEMVDDYDLESEVICLHLKAENGDLEEVEYPPDYYAEIDFGKKVCAICCLR